MFDEKRFKSALVLRGMTVSELAKELGLSSSTLYRKMHRNGDFTREEISMITLILDLEDPNDIFFA